MRPDGKAQGRLIFSVLRATVLQRVLQLADGWLSTTLSSRWGSGRSIIPWPSRTPLFAYQGAMIAAPKRTPTNPTTTGTHHRSSRLCSSALAWRSMAVLIKVEISVVPSGVLEIQVFRASVVASTSV